MRETFQLAIQDFLDESVRHALYDRSRVIVATEDAAEDDNVVDGSFERLPIPFLLGRNKRQEPSGEDTIEIVNEQK
jgi:hypothetical protein